MTRRRLILAACIAAAALGAIWWHWIDRISAEERRLGGTWRVTSIDQRGWRVWTLGSDNVATMTGGPPGAFSGNFFTIKYHWRWDGGRLLFECEDDPKRRIIRPLLQCLRMQVAPLEVYIVEPRGPDQLTVIAPDGTREVWARDGGD
jgi:hypothetical protein